MVERMPEISIIVPVYKAETYLNKCVDSILVQTFSDFELWLVDDGSPDNCGKICDEYAAKDNRIHVIHKQNGGASDARNFGMARATGKYIGFVDSDDIIEPFMYEILYNEIKEKDADIIECRMDKFDSKELIRRYRGESYKAEVLDAEDALKELILEHKLHQMLMNKLFKSDIAKMFSFEVGKICEDEYWTYRVIGEARRVVAIDAILYHYCQREDSVMHQKYSAKRLACIEAFEQRLKYIAEHYPNLYDLANKSYLHACFFHYQMICRNSCIDYDGALRMELYRRFMDGDVKSLMLQETTKQRLWYRLFIAFPKLTCGLRNMFGIGF